ncbi:hypothetical protein [Dyadobacter sp. 32]|uniref:hypothetical protein n=1 Tax=Dyadobacter sp. 32 TaxID=538966 RepID=UPI0011EF0C93
MIEVLKTNVNERFQAVEVLQQLHRTFPGYQANFDLDDCDKILRVESKTERIQSVLIIVMLKNSGFRAEILEDDLLEEHDEAFYLVNDKIN